MDVGAAFRSSGKGRVECPRENGNHSLLPLSLSGACLRDDEEAEGPPPPPPFRLLFFFLCLLFFSFFSFLSRFRFLGYEDEDEDEAETADAAGLASNSRIVLSVSRSRTLRPVAEPDDFAGFMLRTPPKAADAEACVNSRQTRLKMVSFRSHERLKPPRGRW